MVNELAIKKSFLKIKEEMEELKKENLMMKQEILSAKEEIKDPEFANKIAEKIISKIESKLNIDQPKKTEKSNIFENINTIPTEIESAQFIKNKIKNKILELCKEKKESGLIKSIIVDAKKLCSRATFYRYLNELKKEGLIQTIEIDNKAFLISSKNIYNNI